MTACRHRDEADTPGRPTLSLAPEDLFVVGALRSWVAGRRGRRPAAVPDWRSVFAMAELPGPTAEAFAAFLGAVECGMRRPLDIRCCRCPVVGRDEAAALHLLGALQQGDRLAACNVLADWLVPEGFAPALALAAGLASALAAEEVCLGTDTSPGRALHDRAAAH